MKWDPILDSPTLDSPGSSPGIETGPPDPGLGRQQPARIPPEQFDAMYRAAPDPWDFRSSVYERRRYDVTMSVLRRTDYRRCFEPACSIGELTARLAERCDEVVALDPSFAAVTTAAVRLRGCPNVDLRCGAVPEDWPAGAFDLVVLSEIAYYFDPAGVRDLGRRTASSLGPGGGGEVVAVHWRGESADHRLSGDAVHQLLRAELGPPTASYMEPDFRLDSWEVRA